eukprot:1157842-Pelagomonas_calceolata.AAC.2
MPHKFIQIARGSVKASGHITLRAKSAALSGTPYLVRVDVVEGEEGWALDHPRGRQVQGIHDMIWPVSSSSCSSSSSTITTTTGAPRASCTTCVVHRM